ncbi:hypothetical protein GE061_001465 [Apolygus lucorum]|uniref:Uncharacterized protein n=1 Tax=Apolygus lucorum TaxID=248454 RepID=A0A8S9Y755_APOLU|nr:hypothetical protein GE061_001465 [Apolygus lucorum]
MEYQHYGSRGATMTEKKEVDKPCTVGTVLVSERRKPVVTDNEGCATATLTTFPSTSPGITVVPPPTILVNEVKCDQPRTVVYPTTPATMTATAPWEQAVADSTTPAVLTKASLWEHVVADSATHTTLTTPVPFKQDIADPATPAMQTANSLTDVGTTSLRPAVVDTGTPAILTATPATLAATTPVEVTVADAATPEMLTTTPQTLISVEPTIADPATPAMPATLPAMLPPAMPPEILRNTISHLHTTLAPDISHPDTNPPQEPFTVLVPIKDEPINDDQTLSSNDVTKEVPPTTQEHEGLSFLTFHQCQPANDSKYLLPVAAIGEGTRRSRRDRHCPQISGGIYLTSQVHHTESGTTTLTHEANLTIP